MCDDLAVNVHISLYESGQFFTLFENRPADVFSLQMKFIDWLRQVQKQTLKKSFHRVSKFVCLFS